MDSASFFDDFLVHFDSLTDPRVERCRRHDLSDILLLTVLAVLCGAESWTEVELFGKSRESELKALLKLPNGLPSHDTIGRVFSLLNALEFERCFIQWAQSLMRVEGEQIVAIDGKSLRRSHNRNKQRVMLHLVSAYATDQGLMLGQIKTEDHSNEIKVIPELVKQLQLAGSTVTIDAMGCQKDIAKSIRDQQADYVLVLKGNQGNLHEDVVVYWESELAKAAETKHGYYETHDQGHGRVEERRHWVSDDIEWLRERHPHWPDLHSIGVVESHRHIDGKESIERRFYISSRQANAQHFARAVRQHWRIGNQLHWVLDVSFNEEQSRVREGHAAQNFAIIRRMALNMLKQEPSKLSMKAKRRKAGWDFAFMCKVLNANDL